MLVPHCIAKGLSFHNLPGRKTIMLSNPPSQIWMSVKYWYFLFPKHQRLPAKLSAWIGHNPVLFPDWVGDGLDLHWWGEIVKNNSLMTLGCISSGPTDLRIFRFLRCSWTWFLLTVGGTLLPEPPSCCPATPGMWKLRSSPLKTGTQNLLSSSAFSLSIFTSFPALFIKGWHLLWPSFPGCQAWRRLSCHSLCPLSGWVPALPSSALPHTTKFHP